MVLNIFSDSFDDPKSFRKYTMKQNKIYLILKGDMEMIIDFLNSESKSSQEKEKRHSAFKFKI